MGFTNKVQLITYPDSLGGGLAALHDVLRHDFPGLFPGGVHILPPFPSSGDRGFAPLDYERISPEFGTWEDLQRIGAGTPIMLDVMVNHMSRQSAPVQDFLSRGSASPYADMFITPDKVWRDGPPSEADLARLALRRASPFSRYRVGEDGREVTLWTTFGRQDPSEQVDLDWRSPAYRRFIGDVLQGLHRRGVSLVRLDAIGYVVKKPGTDCFFVQPDIYEFLRWIRGLADGMRIEILPELHARPELQEALGAEGYWTYDFILPYAILEALLRGEPSLLRRHLGRRSPRQFTMLDCHDGIPLKPDLDGLYDPASARAVAQACGDRGGNFSRIMSPSHRDPDGFDVHQIRCTYYSALGESDERYLAARAIQLFAPGVPQVYYVGLLAGGNDAEAVQRTGEGREINRHNYTRREIQENVRRPVVRKLMDLLRFRNTYPAFDGSFRILPAHASELKMRWENGRDACTLAVEFPAGRASIEYLDRSGRIVSDLL